MSEQATEVALCGYSGGHTSLRHECLCQQPFDHDNPVHTCPCGVAWRFCFDCGLVVNRAICSRCGYDFTEDGDAADPYEALRSWILHNPAPVPVGSEPSKEAEK